MKKRLLVYILAFAPLVLMAQEFGIHWIAAPQPDSTSHLWFRHTCIMEGRPRQASITVATTGYFKLYINQHNVGTALFYPSRQPYSNNVVTTSFDITRYMRNDTNVVALVYSPTFAHLNHRQLSVTLHGLTAMGQPFCTVSDGSWLCKPANSCINAWGGETIDGRSHTPSWKDTAFDLALWQPARPVTTGPTGYAATPSSPADPLPVIVRRRSYDYFDPLLEAAEYEFGTAFRGRIRLTLREARRGQAIQVGRMRYICSGNLDEQAAPVFSIDTYRRVLVQGDRRFRREQITDIEAIETTLAPATYDAP